MISEIVKSNLPLRRHLYIKDSSLGPWETWIHTISSSMIQRTFIMWTLSRGPLVSILERFDYISSFVKDFTSCSSPTCTTKWDQGVICHAWFQHDCQVPCRAKSRNKSIVYGFWWLCYLNLAYSSWLLPGVRHPGIFMYNCTEFIPRIVWPMWLNIFPGVTTWRTMQSIQSMNLMPAISKAYNQWTSMPAPEIWLSKPHLNSLWRQLLSTALTLANGGSLVSSWSCVFHLNDNRKIFIIGINTQYKNFKLS